MSEQLNPIGTYRHIGDDHIVTIAGKQPLYRGSYLEAERFASLYGARIIDGTVVAVS